MGSVHKVIFHMDGKGVIYAPNEPIHLDSLIHYAGAFRYDPVFSPPGRDDPLGEILPIPVRQQKINGSLVYRASALSPEGAIAHHRRHWRCRFRNERNHLCEDRTINQSTGFFKASNVPLDLLLCERMVGWVDGTPRDIRNWLKRSVQALGKKRSMGHGRVVRIEIEPSEEDRCLSWEGRATRYYPHPEGLKRVRPTPPYWHNEDRVSCLVPGEEIP